MAANRQFVARERDSNSRQGARSLCDAEVVGDDGLEPPAFCV